MPDADFGAASKMALKISIQPVYAFCNDNFPAKPMRPLQQLYARLPLFRIFNSKITNMRFLLLTLLCATGLFAQTTSDDVKPENKPLPPPMINRDSLYREDQFYVGVTYNRLVNKRAGMTQNKFSSGFTAGMLRDIPLNKRRTWAIATGLGATYNKYFHNVVVTKNEEERFYNFATPGVQYDKNKYEQLLIDVPLELRWRNSTPDSHKFWRVYTGFKFSYAALAQSRYVDNTYDITVANNPDVNRVQLGAYIASGYNTWNVYCYYGFTSFYKSSAQIDGRSVGLNPLHFGLMFYIL